MSTSWTQRPRCAGGPGKGARATAPAWAAWPAWIVTGLAAGVAGLAGCQGPGARGTPGESSGAPTVPAELAVVALADVAGLSGAATDARGVLWMVPERRHVLIEQGDAPRVWPLAGVPDEGLDLESLAWLGMHEGRERFAVGTEGVCERNTHAVLVVERQGEGFGVIETVRLPLDLWPETVCEDGHGLEGLCAALGPQGEVHLVAAIEHPERDADGRRFAPLGVRGPDGAWRALRVGLTSETGKISGLDCRVVEQGIEVWAIERHFETSRLVRFLVPAAGAQVGPNVPIGPAVVLDLWPHTDGGRRNFEGVTVTGDRVRVLVDNQWRTITGPNEILSLTLPAQP
jgi:hypothetical protein